MQHSKKLEKSKGIILFAFNNKDTNYVDIAEQAVKLINKSIGLPVTLVTGPDEIVAFDVHTLIRVDNKKTNTRFSTDKNKTVEWKNFGRYLAYKFSPYDETLLLDTDYLVLSDNLLKYFETEWDYLFPSRNINLGQPEIIDTMGAFSLPYVWATTIAFRKTEKTEMLFELVSRIQDNYPYYRKLYSIANTHFRNDYAFAIADYILNGYSANIKTKMHHSLTTVIGQVKSISQNKGMLHIKYDSTALVSPVQDLHVLSKDYLLSKDFTQFVEGFCNA